MWQVGDPFKVILWYRYCAIADVDALIETLQNHFLVYSSTSTCSSSTSSTRSSDNTTTNNTSTNSSTCNNNSTCNNSTISTSSNGRSNNNIATATASATATATSTPKFGILGRMLISSEGMNGTLAGSCEDIDSFIEYLSLSFPHIDWKCHIERNPQKCEYLPFLQLSIRKVSEIISCGMSRSFIDDFVQYDANSYGGLQGSGVHLEPKEFHDMLEHEQGKDNCILLDIRNEFEYDIGHFDNALGVGTFTYAETFKVLDSVLDDEFKKSDEANNKQISLEASNNKDDEIGNDNGKKIMMYCTGGIRCEKASAYLRAKGLNNVYQLQGGIHRYLEQFPDGGKFLGKNFVFDSRVAVSGEQAVTAASEHFEGSYSLGGGSVVVGKCIDCQSPFDKYSGFIVCTVCRMPVLVCDSCVEHNLHPGEFYCTRHRDLKGIYFTVLERFTRYELEEQKKALQMLLQKCIMLNDQDHNLKTTLGKDEQESIQLNIPHPFTYSKRRRQTLRKQIQKIEERIAVLTSDDHDHCTVDLLSTINPKVKDGWGFWRTSASHAFPNKLTTNF